MLSSLGEIKGQFTLFVRLFVAALVLAFLAIGFAPAAVADSTYKYTGQPYDPNSPNFCNGTYIPVCSSIGVSATIVLANPLGDNLVNAPVSPVSFTFSGGTDAFTLTQATSLPIELLEFSTDSNGNIIGWGIQLATDSGANSGCTPGPLNFVCLGTYSNSNGAGDYSAYDYNHGTSNEVYGAGTNSVAGSWALVTTPEPSSLVLLGSGLLGVFARRRRIRQRHSLTRKYPVTWYI